LHTNKSFAVRCAERSCTNDKAKILLAKEWKEKYSKVRYDELIRVAKNKTLAKQ